jgi:hypothetical protein
MAGHEGRHVEQTGMIRPAGLKILFAVLLVLTAAAALLLTGCSSVPSETMRYVGAPQPPPTDPARVAILRNAPKRPHEKLGEVVLTPSDDPPVSAIEKKIREETAKLGGDAAVLVYDRTKRMGTVVTGTWWVLHARPLYGRVIVALDGRRFTGAVRSSPGGRS